MSHKQNSSDNSHNNFHSIDDVDTYIDNNDDLLTVLLLLTYGFLLLYFTIKRFVSFVFQQIYFG